MRDVPKLEATQALVLGVGKTIQRVGIGTSFGLELQRNGRGVRLWQKTE